LVVSRASLYGALAIAAPVFTLSILNCTLATATLSVALADTVTVADTVALFAGAVMFTTGGVVSGEVTVKGTPLLGTPGSVTTTFPVVAPLGTGTMMRVVVQLVGVPAIPWNETVPRAAPKFVPAIVTDVPTGPDVGLMLVMFGVGAAAAPDLNPAIPAPQVVAALSDALAEAGPAVACI